MAVGKILRQVLRNTTFSMAVGIVLVLLLNGFIYCPPVEDDSSAAPSPGDSSACPCVCSPPDGGLCVDLSRKARDVVALLLGALCQLTARALFGNPFAADDDDQEEAAGAAKKAGYVAIREDDVEVGKN